MNSILLLEDDLKLASELTLFLEGEGFRCTTIHTGTDVLGHPEKFDLYILDINVPVLDGMEVCRQIRKRNQHSAILMLTAYSTMAYKLQSFDAGADDYLIKPFHTGELLVRIKALLRRASPVHLQEETEDTGFKVGDLVVNTTEMSVTRAGREIILTPKEYRLLELLAAANGRIVSKQVIAEKVWDINFETGTNTIEVYINFLRSKIDKDFETKLIHTRPGYGYYLKANS
ncbi:response regulator transcription factor [Pedobacter sp. SYP-B3415]|uniref:response regulator transcription factor n=1 Tax=Pedobacter sp. SYP-B3415 TaxID=2496641 RepID=UPI00101BD2DE|nr:response regulator transcription factor [Pedobacter sp. SYP-B3415]